MNDNYADRTWTSVDGLQLYARDYAGLDGPAKLPVVCIHGLTRNSRDFEDVAPWIAARGRRVLAVDVRGRGRSDRDPNPANYQPAVYAADMVGLMMQAGIGRAVFVEPNAFCPLFYAQIAGTPGMTFRADGGIVRMRAGRLRRAAAAAGLVDVATATFGMLPPALVNRPRGRALEALAERPEALAPVRAFRVLSGRAAQAGL